MKESGAAGITYEKNDGGNIVIPVNDDKIELVKGEVIENSDVICTRRNSIMYLPLRTICETFGKTVEWNGETRSVYID